MFIPPNNQSLPDQFLPAVTVGVLLGISWEEAGRLAGQLVAFLTENDPIILELFFRIVATDTSLRILTNNYRDESSYLVLKSAIVVMLTITAVAGLPEIKPHFIVSQREQSRMNLLAFLSGATIAITLENIISHFHPTTGLVVGIVAAHEIARASFALHIRAATVRSLR